MTHLMTSCILFIITERMERETERKDKICVSTHKSGHRTDLKIWPCVNVHLHRSVCLDVKRNERKHRPCCGCKWDLLFGRPTHLALLLHNPTNLGKSLHNLNLLLNLKHRQFAKYLKICILTSLQNHLLDTQRKYSPVLSLLSSTWSEFSSSTKNRKYNLTEHVKSSLAPV